MFRALSALATAMVLSLATVGCITTEAERQQADALRELGLTYLHEGHTPDAIDMLQQSLELNPKDARTHHELGLAYFSREIYPEAEASMLRGLELDPKLSEARLNLSSLYIASGRYQDAIDQLNLIVSDPLYRRPHRAHNNLGWAHYKLGQYEQAETAYRKALKLAPGFCQAHFNLALVMEATSRPDLAAKQFQRAVEKCPNDGRYQLEYAAILMRMERFGEAIPYLERVSAADPDGLLGDRAREYLQVVP